MRTWEELITEENEKGKSHYQKYLNKQLAFKIKKYEAQKKAQLERLKKAKTQKQTQKAKASLSKIKFQMISDKDKVGTAYSKLIGNVGSAAVGVGGAVVHGAKALAAERKADAEAKASEGNQPEKKEKKSAGRPPSVEENYLSKMRTWKEVIKEATAAEIRRAGEAALRDERKKNKEEKTQKGKSHYQKYLNKQLKFKKEKYEDQKRARIERLKKKNSPLGQANASLANIKTQQISDKDKVGTAYSKLIGNVGSAAVGVGGAVVHTVRAIKARREAENEKHNQPEKRKRKSAGRPPGGPSPAGGGGSGGPSPAGPKLLVPSTKRLPPSGGTGGRGPKKQTLGQRARNNPAIKAGLIAQRIESYSNWRNELLVEVEVMDKIKEKRSKKKNIVDVMPKNKRNAIEINPDERTIR